MLTDKDKYVLRVKLRLAIKRANTEWQFSCYACKYCYSDDNGKTVQCDKGVARVPSRERLPAHLLPECFFLDHMDSPYGELLTWLAEQSGIETFEIKTGWPTVVVRLLTLAANNVGHVMNVSNRNLEKFS